MATRTAPRTQALWARTVLILLLATAMLGLGLIVPGHAVPGDCDVLDSGGGIELSAGLFGGVAEAAESGLTNMGFETGDFTAWTTGPVTDSVEVVTGDTALPTPFHGTYMARLGTNADNAGVSQPPGPNAICQQFVVDQATESFVYNVFTWDYSGFDDFQFRVEVVNPATGEVIASQRQGAWAVDVALKTTGWTGVELDLSGHIGETVEIIFSGGGTSDSLYPFWVYLDDTGGGALPLPVVPPPVLEIPGDLGSSYTDPVTGDVVFALPWGALGGTDALEIDVTVAPECPGEPPFPPSDVTVLVGGVGLDTAPNGDGTWSAVIPEHLIADGAAITVAMDCDGVPFFEMVGTIVLYDPSGFVTDADTGAPVLGAVVTLHKALGWTPDGVDPDPAAKECETLDSRVDGEWTQPAPVDDGILANPLTGEMSPAVTAMATNGVGHYGWDVAEGCWFVTVSAPGYAPLTSPVVGVPPEVTDLDLALTPLGDEGTTLQEQIQEQADLLGALTSDDKHDAKKLDKAVKKLAKGLDADLWDEDGEPVDHKAKSKVFKAMAATAKELGKVGSDDALGIIDALVEIAHEHAVAKVAAAADVVAGTGDAKDAKKAAKELDKAAKELDKAAKELDKGKPDKAIHKFAKACQKATKAIEKATG